MLSKIEQLAEKLRKTADSLDKITASDLKEPELKFFQDKDDQMNKYLENVGGAVEANSFESLCLWKEYYQELKKEWKSDGSGFHVTVGQYGEMPICISITKNEVDGVVILFYDAVSLVVHHDAVRKWLKDHLPEKAKSNITNAMNFHNIFHHVKWEKENG